MRNKMMTDCERTLVSAATAEGRAVPASRFFLKKWPTVTVKSTLLTVHEFGGCPHDFQCGVSRKNFSWSE